MLPAEPQLRNESEGGNRQATMGWFYATSQIGNMAKSHRGSTEKEWEAEGMCRLLKAK